MSASGLSLRLIALFVFGASLTFVFGASLTAAAPSEALTSAKEPPSPESAAGGTPDVEDLAAQIARVEAIARDQLEEERLAKAEAVKAQKAAEEAAMRAKRLAAAAEERSNLSEAAKVAAAEEAEEARKLANEAQERSELMADRAERQALEAQDAEAKAQALRENLKIETRNRWIAIVAGVLGLGLAIAAWWLVRRTRKRAKASIHALEAERPQPVADCILTSDTRNLQLPGRQLPEAAGGVIIGRNPEMSVAVIDFEDISREHARIFHSAGEFFLEDLGSTYGSALDGKQLQPRRARPLHNGSEVSFAGHIFTFQMLATEH